MTRKRRLSRQDNIENDVKKGDDLYKHKMEDVQETLVEEEVEHYHYEMENVEVFEECIAENDTQHDFVEGQLDIPITMKKRNSIVPRKRRPAAGNQFINYAAPKYYDRYKSQDYARRNDLMKYCHVCRKKVIGKLRVLPGDLKMRKVWILRSNLDADRSAELWLRELACEGSHGGEHTKYFLFDRRPLEGRHTVVEDISFDFDSLVLDCVYCGQQNNLNNMMPVIRNRAKRALWVEALSDGDEEVKTRLQTLLKGGVTRFICDWHMADSTFEINSFGEWRLLKNALPDPSLRECDKMGARTYLVDKPRDVSFWEKDLWKKVDILSAVDHIADSSSSSSSRDKLIEDSFVEIDCETKATSVGKQSKEKAEQKTVACKFEVDDVDVESNAVREIALSRQGQKKQLDFIAGTAGTSNSFEGGNSEDYSDESDAENEAVNKLEEMPYVERFCQVCSRIVDVNSPSEFANLPRTWPFDECRHEKWLELMDWPRDFEDSMRSLWLKRRNESNLSSDGYHFCPINVCQSHLDFRKVGEKMDAWLRTYCVVCEVCLKSESLLVPLPQSQQQRIVWIETLLPQIRNSKTRAKKWSWLRERLTRRKPTKYRMCVFHFSQEAFVEKDNKCVFTGRALPLPLTHDEVVPIPRGPDAVSKCLMCDDWKKQSDMQELRWPNTDSEKVFLTDAIFGADRVYVRRAIDYMTTVKKPILICSYHFPDQMNPFDLIAERRISYGITVECILCSHCEDASGMVPFPSEAAAKTRWLNAMCREPWVHRFLSERLSVEGRHYLCAAHFHKNALRFFPGLGLWKRSGYVPLLACHSEEEKNAVQLLAKNRDEYRPVLIQGLDENGIKPIEYDFVVQYLGEARIKEIEDEIYGLVMSCQKEDDGEVENEVYEEEVFEETTQVFEIPEDLEQSQMAFTFAAFCYLLALIAVGFCVFFAIYTVICVDELRTDYKNPIEQCRNLNQLILPEYLIHGIYSLMFVFSWQLIAILMNLPLALYHIYSYLNRPVMSGPGIYDPTTILNRSVLSSTLRVSWAKLAFYLISFFYYLYAMIYTLVTSS
ncbi:unnamed protein product [Caenorhabditis auriculariae]|uniref:THAP-type domain-containing protein n=1 Tax=Caenorhabditis auriculariae TaxID=2777116 RepID=A0A8S1HFT2_9PELO|nr:unnamed protein product [Caenorhabditis auriculariae]